MPRPKLVTPDGRFIVPVVIDTREQLAFSFTGLKCDAADGGGPLTVPTVRGTLACGDYSLLGFESRVAVERKSLADLFGTLGQGRERFERKLARLAEYDFAAVVIEGDWRAITGAYPVELLTLKQEFIGRLARRDPGGPWGEWVAMLDAVMPGPPVHSQLNPKTVFRSAVAWMVRHGVHWQACPNRAFAEQVTFRLLERFLKEDLSRGEAAGPARHRPTGQ